MGERKTWIKLSVVFVLTFVYAYVRYITFGTIASTHIPTVIVNKAIAFSIVVWLIFLIRDYFNQKSECLKLKLNILQSLIFIHIFLTVILLSQQQLPKFFANGELTLWGNLTVLSGTITLSIFFWLSKKVGKITLLLFSTLLKTHLFFMGFKGWLTPSAWNAGMPPITLICFILLLILDVRILKNKK